MQEKSAKSDAIQESAKAGEIPTCGIVMPIASTDGCDPTHWQDVKNILFEACETAGFSPFLVSDAADSGTILRRIVSNLYNCDMVIADVSGKNPNVMFELGMRLAFDKPAVIAKDDQTGYSFDTGVIEHLGYPRDLHFYSVIDFKSKLAEKLMATHKAAKDPKYTTFLKHFGEYTASRLQTKEINGAEYLLQIVTELRDEVSGLRSQIRRDADRRSIDIRTELLERIKPYVRQFHKDSKHATHSEINDFLVAKIPEARMLSSRELDELIRFAM